MHRFIYEINRRLKQKSRISRKYFLSVLCIFLVPLLTFSYAFFYKYKNIILEEILSSYEQIVGQYNSNLRYKLEIYNNLLENISVNGVIQDIFYRQDEFSSNDTLLISRRISNEINSIISLKKKNEVYNITLYANNSEFPIDGNHLGNIDKIKDSFWYDSLRKTGNFSTFFYYRTKVTGEEIISMTIPIIDTRGNSFKSNLGIAKLDIYASRIFGLSEYQNNPHNKRVFIMDENNELIYSSNGKTATADEEKQIRGALANANKGNNVTRIFNEKKLVVARPVGVHGWKSVFFFSYDETETKLMGAVRFIILLIAILLFILVLLTLLFSRLLSRRFNILVNKMKKVEKGDLKISDRIDGNDELAKIDRHFDRMVVKLSELIDQNYIQRIEKKEAELNALQLQINPHFLYNTLESINAIASVYGCCEICDISQKLGNMFRYSINIGRNEFVFLRDEIAHTKNYIDIQSIRFSNRFDVVYDIPEELHNCMILKFILQPIVENSIYHGFKGKKGKGTLIISACRMDNNIRLKVEDDGCGMEPGQVEYLNNYINEREITLHREFKKSIGIRNVNSRIKLTYGKEYGISITSKKQSGTSVNILLPLRESMREAT